MLNSKELLEQTGISRATLNNYIGWGIVPRPEVLPPGPQDGDAPRLGYFPDGVVERVEEIQRLKKQGWSMARIAEHFAPPPGNAAAARVTSSPAAPGIAAGPAENEDGPAQPARGPAAFASPPPAAGAATDAGHRRGPVLMHVAVLVAALQHSRRIWSELPPEEYFELINDVWSTVDPIFGRHAAINGKHPADGMVAYFLPLPAAGHLWNALAAASEMRFAMRKVSKQWQLRKGWSSELYLNIGIDEGQEWLGTFKSAQGLELTALARTLSHASRISDFARFGAIWVSKTLIGKLSAQERRRLTYGVHRKTADGQHVFVSSVFSNLQPAAAPPAPGGEEFRDSGMLPITEIVDIAPATGR